MMTTHHGKIRISRAGIGLVTLACGLTTLGHEAPKPLDWSPVSDIAPNDFSNKTRFKIVYERMKQKGDAAPAEMMRQTLVLERWDDIKKLIDGQPEASRPQIARILLEVIKNGRPWVQPSAPPPPPVNPRLKPVVDPGVDEEGNPRPPQPAAPAVPLADLPGMRNTTLEHVLMLAGYLPVPAESKDTNLLAAVLRPWLDGNAAGQRLVAERLRQGIAGWGGASAQGKLETITLFDASNQPVLALSFLPSLEEAKKNDNLDLVWRHWQGMWEQAVAAGIRDQYLNCWDLANNWLAIRTDLTADRRKILYEAQLRCLPFLDEKLGNDWLAKRLETPNDEEILITKVFLLEANKMKAASETERVNLLKLNNLLLRALFEKERQKPAGRACILGQMINYWQDELVQAVNKQRELEQQEESYRYRYPKPAIKYSDANAASQETVNRLKPPVEIAQVLEVADKIKNYQSSLRLAISQDAQKQTDFAESRQILRELAKLDPYVAMAMASELMASLTGSFNANPVDQRQQRMIYYGGMQPPTPIGVPLTRARQERNLKILKSAAEDLRTFLPEALPADAMVKAFIACHSPAEVYRLDNIRNIFAPLDKMPVEQVFQFAETMRTQLAKSWQDAKVQQAAQTNRTPAQTIDEVRLGYASLQTFLDEVSKNRNEEWLLTLYFGVVAFDRAEFDYANGSKLDDYAKRRNQAFDAMEMACDRYMVALKTGKIPTPGERPWLMWFNSVLQASSLANPGIEVDDEKKIVSSFRSQVDRVRDSLRKLPEGAYTYHRDRLAETLYTQAVGAGEGKMLWLERSYNLIKTPTPGTHPDDARPNPVADRISALLTFYQELLNEIHLQVDIDGNSSIRPDEDFGMLVSVRHTVMLGRESGGFGRYLTNQSQPIYYGGQQQEPRKYRDDMDKAIKAALENNFVVRSITFLDPSVRPLPLGESEQTTPLAYVQLAPKDKVKDSIPSMKFNFDFIDRAGQVILPVASTPIAIKVEAEAGPRPVKDLDITQTFDQRKLGEGKAQLEIISTGKGVLPGLADLFGAKSAAQLEEGREFQGFLIKRITDSGSQVNQVEEKDNLVEVSGERSWIIELEATDIGSLPSSFSFGKMFRIIRNVFKPDLGSLPPAFDFLPVEFKDAKALYKQYRDADLAETGPSVTIEIPGRSRLLSFTVKAILAMLVMLGAFWFWRRTMAKVAVPSEAVVFELPANLTPFSALHLLEQIRASGRLEPAALIDLDQDIQALQKQYFAPGSVAPSANEAELRALCSNWISRA